MGVYHIAFHQPPQGIENHQFAAGAKSRVYCQDPASAQGWLQEKMAQVLGKDLYRSLLRPLTSYGYRLRLEGWCQKPAEGVLGSGLDQIGGWTVPLNEDLLQDGQGILFVDRQMEENTPSWPL